MENCLITELESGEFNAMDIIEVTEVPDISILVKDISEEKEYVQKNKKDFETLVTEFFFGCKQDFTTQYQNQDYSLSLVFKSEEVKNQTYNANVKIYLIIRGICENKEYLISRMNELKNVVKSSLAGMKYGITDLKNKQETISSIREIACKDKRIISKDYRMDNLQSNYFPECFSFDKMPSQDENFAKIVTSLMRYPDAEIIIDLIPSVFTTNEINNLEVVL